jgi:hypothetical protein
MIAEAFELTRQLQQPCSAPAQVRLQTRLQELQAALAQVGHRIERQPQAMGAIPLAVRQAFAEAIALLPFYYQLGGATWQGTVTSLTLNRYTREVLPPNLAAVSPAELAQKYQLPAEAEAELALFLTSVQTQIQQQGQIIAAALHQVGVLPNPVQAPAAAVQALFTHLFGRLPIPEAALAILCTETQIYFCLDTEGTRLRDPAVWAQLTASEQTQITTFLEDHHRFKFEQFSSFPTFCWCDPATIDPGWVAQLTQATGFSRSQICQTLSQGVGLIPTYQAEKFFLHDIWGHNWQATLTQFRGDYRILADCHQPLRIGETAYTEHGPLTCRELFQAHGHQVQLDVEAARLFFQGEVRQRLGVMFTHLIGEMIADVAEFKFIWDHPDLSAALPSSSTFKQSPTKLDFACLDLDFLFLRVLQPLLEIRVSMAELSTLEQELLATWWIGEPTQAPLELQASLKRALIQLYQVFFDEYSLTCLPTLTNARSIFADVLANAIHLQNVINSLCTDKTLNGPSDIPLQVLLLLFMGRYCCGDSYEDFWGVDNAIAQFFLPLFQQCSQ